MVNKKISRIIGPAAGIMVFMMSIGIIPVQAYDVDTQSVKSEAAISGNENMNYEIEQNGIKLKITDIIGTKNRIKIDAYITREDGFDEDIHSHRNMELNIYMDKAKVNSSSTSWSYPDNKTIKINSEQESDDGFLEKGNIRADLVLGDYDFNGSLVIPVDFTESFNQYMKKDLDVSFDKNDKITGFESDAIGTRLILLRDIDDTRYGVSEPSFIIKVGNKIYFASYSGGRSYSSADESYKCYFETQNLTYNDIKDAESISVIPIKSTFTSDDIEKQYKDNSYYEKLLKEAVVSDNIKYNKEVNFTDGTKGELKVERTGDKINIYCSSDSDNKSLILANGIYGIFTDGIDDYSNSIFEKNKTMFKDENTENQYVVQFKDSHPEMMFQANIDILSLNSDKFDIGDEIKIK